MMTVSDLSKNNWGGPVFAEPEAVRGVVAGRGSPPPCKGVIWCILRDSGNKNVIVKTSITHATHIHN